MFVGVHTSTFILLKQLLLLLRSLPCYNCCCCYWFCPRCVNNKPAAAAAAAAAAPVSNTVDAVSHLSLDLVQCRSHYSLLNLLPCCAEPWA